MAQPFIGEIRLVGFNFAPVGWASCNGQLLSIANYSALFTLIGTTYGGDGKTTFAVPDLRSRIPVHEGTNGNTYAVGELGGAENVTLTTAQIPSHSHTARCNSGATQTAASPAGAAWTNYSQNQYTTQATAATMNSQAVATTGGNQAHNNLMPYLTVNFIIALFGIFPTHS